MIAATVPDGLKIRLRYIGKAVDDGTMPIADVLDALEGFSGAYSKVASSEGTQIRHELRLSAIDAGSFELILLAWVALNQTAGVLQTFETLRGAARWVVSQVTGVISAKKHVGGEPYSIDVSGSGNTVTVINMQGARLELPPKVLEIFKERLIDSDLSKIVAPLQPDVITAVQIMAGDDGETIEQTITSAEIESFRNPETTTTSKEAEIEGTLVSLNKENNRGSFRLKNGKNIRYRYAGNDPVRFYVDFARRGQVKVRCMAWFDENLSPDRLDIYSVLHLQGTLLPHSEGG